MAQSHGNIANYPASQRRAFLLRALLLITIAEFACGLLVGLALGTSILPSFPAWAGHLLFWTFAAAAVVLGFWAYRWLDRNEQSFFQFVEGARGEAAVAEQLQKLPNGFHAIHGLKTPNGDVDHLVIGPTGVFVLDAKRWNAHVSADRGRLVRNGRPMDEDHVGRLQRTVMVVRDMLVTAGGPDPYFQGALVFVGSSVQIPQGALGRTDALTPDQVVPYLTRTQGRRGLSPQDVELLAARAAGHVRA